MGDGSGPSGQRSGLGLLQKASSKSDPSRARRAAGRAESAAGFVGRAGPALPHGRDQRRHSLRPPVPRQGA